MTKQIIPTSPLSDEEEILIKKFIESITKQSDLMDKLGVQILTIYDLAIPGIYATALKLVRGEDATLLIKPALYLTFICWFTSLVLTLIALIPKKWKVDPTIIQQDPNKMTEGLGIEDFFNQSALYKRRLIIPSCLIFFIGIISSVFTIG